MERVSPQVNVKGEQNINSSATPGKSEETAAYFISESFRTRDGLEVSKIFTDLPVAGRPSLSGRRASDARKESILTGKLNT